MNQRLHIFYEHHFFFFFVVVIYHFSINFIFYQNLWQMETFFFLKEYFWLSWNFSKLILKFVILLNEYSVLGNIFEVGYLLCRKKRSRSRDRDRDKDKDRDRDRRRWVKRKAGTGSKESEFHFRHVHDSSSVQDMTVKRQIKKINVQIYV